LLFQCVIADFASPAEGAALLCFEPSKPNANQIMTGNNSGAHPLTMTGFTIAAGPFAATMHLPLWPRLAPLSGYGRAGPFRTIKTKVWMAASGAPQRSRFIRRRCGWERSRISEKALSAMTVEGAN
jgi:hypothetical protein